MCANASAGRLRSTETTQIIHSTLRLVRSLLCGLPAVLLPAILAAQTAKPLPPTPAVQARLAADFGKIPLSFEQNRGQSDPRVQFLSHGMGYGLFLTSDEAVLELKQAHKRGSAAGHTVSETAVLRMKLLGADRAVVATGNERLPGTSNYFIGNDSTRWAKDVPSYQRVNLPAVYPGIDLVYYGNQRQLEYDFVVAPHANPARIALSFTGATPHIDGAGDLILSGQGHQTSFHAPVAYQLAGNDRIPVSSAYALKNGEVSFSLGVYDHSKPLIIDPVLTYATFLGGSNLDEGNGIGTDAAGNTYIGGDTASMNFPTANAFDSVNIDNSNGYNLFVTKLNPAGTAILYSTYLGGTYDTTGGNLAVDAAGSVYIVGTTSAGDYPVTPGAFQTICGANYSNATGTRVRINGCTSASGNSSGVVTKLSPAGNTLAYSTFLSGDAYNSVAAIAVDAAGEAYVVGDTGAFCGSAPYYPASSFDSYDCFPVTASHFQDGTQIGGGGQTGFGFFTKFSADGSTLLYSTILGAVPGSNGGGNLLSTDLYAVAVDASGYAYVTGNAGYGVATTAGAFYVPPVNNSTTLPPQPAYLAKINPAASGAASLVYATFLGSAAQTANGTNYNNTATGIAVDASGNAIVAGYNNTCGYPTTPGAFQTVSINVAPCNDSFITKVNATGTALVWSTVLSGTGGSTVINGLAQDASGNIYVTGALSGGGLPTVNPIEKTVNGGAFVSEINPTGTKLLFSTYLSGYYGSDYGKAVAVDATGNIYLTGRVDAATPTIPVTAGAIQAKYGGGAYDAYAIKIAPLYSSTVALTLAAASVNAGTTATLTAVVAGPTGSPVPTGTVTFLNGATSMGTGTLDATGKTVLTSSTLAVGTYAVTASFGGDANFNASASTPAQALAVVANSTSVGLAASATSALTGTSLVFTASVAPASSTITPTGTVTFKDGTTTLGTGTLSGGKTTYTTTTLAVGVHSITASYGGDSNDVASVSTALSITITSPPADFSLSLTPTAGTIAAGSSLSIVITEAPLNGFAAATTFACSGAPTYSTCTFTPSSLTPNGTASSSTTLVIATNVATAALEPLRLPNVGEREVTVVLAMLFLLPLAGRRDRTLLRRRTLTALMLTLGLMGLAMTGCSSGSTSTTTTPTKVTPTGTYPVTVTATSGTITHSATYTVTVQ